ncbi:MAG TPA: LCCL domain-containing protein, partial [Acidimicrobiales bacterium]|nr:LCCL domain-containing protein [Acidimicrobiales bacterium]
LRPDVLFIAGETIRTGAGTSVRVRYDTGAVVRIEAESTLTVGGRPTRATSRGDFLGRLLHGIADFYAPTSPAGFEVETRRVVVGIRGTEFRLTHAFGATSVEVTSGLVDVTDLETGTVVALGAGDAWSSAGAADALAGGMAPIAPPPDVAAVAPPGWRAVDTGVVCFAVPPTWTDQTADARRGADGEVLAAWAAPFTTGLMPATTFLSLLAPDDVASELAKMAADPDFSLRREVGAPFAGEPATWREYDVAGEGRLTMVATSPRSDGRILVSIVAERYDAPPGTEADVQEILGSFTACGAQAPSDPQAALPPATPAPVGTIPLACADTADGGALGSLAIGDGALVSCPALCTADHAVWGTDVYSDDSSVCRAGIHAGAIDATSGGSFAIVVRGGRDRYVGSARNGVTTRDWGAWHRSFVIDASAMPPGAAPVAPPPEPAEVGRTPDVVIDLPTQRGELSASQTSERHAITIDRPGDLRVAVQASGDLTIHAYLLDTNGTTPLHTQNAGYESQRTVERAGLAPGTYHLRIDRTRGHGGYTIESTLTAITTPDDREPNDALAQAQPITLGTTTTGRLGYGNAERGTDTTDWYTIRTDHDGDLRIHVQADDRLSLHAYLLDTNGTTPLHVQNTGYESARTVERAGLAPGTYHLRIDRTRGHGGYTIEPMLTPETTPSDREPNDALTQAQSITLGSTTTGRLGYGNAERGTDTADWYTIRTDQDDDLSIRIQADDRLSLHAYLLDTNGTTPLHVQNTGYESAR